MGIYIIARLQKDNREIGYRLYGTGNHMTDDWQTSRVIEALKLNVIKPNVINLKNAALDEHGKLKGTMGALKNYPLYDIDSRRIVSQNSYTIVGKDINDGMFHTVEGYGQHWKISEQTLIELLQRVRTDVPGLTNAIFVKNTPNKYIKSKGGFETIGFDFLKRDFDTPNNRGYVEKWQVRIIKPGESYGDKYHLVNKDKTLVEFFSMDTYQMVSRYYLDTLLEREDDSPYGLDLYGDVSAWKIDGKDYNRIIKWLRSLNI